MSKILLVISTAFLLFIALPCVSSAAPLKTYVTEFNVAGASNRDELKTTLQGLLASRLNPERMQLVENPDKAELQLSGSYALFGKMFSIDVLLKNTLTGSLTKVFEQGENQDDLIPAFGRLAQWGGRIAGESLISSPRELAVIVRDRQARAVKQQREDDARVVREAAKATRRAERERELAEHRAERSAQEAQKKAMRQAR